MVDAIFLVAAVRAVHDTLKALRDGMPPERLEGIASDDLMERAMRNDGYVRWVKECV